MNIVVGITGGIAAYKAPELVRLLVKAGHAVRCAATEHALQFVTRVTLETVSQNPLYCDLFAGNDHSTEHISLKDWADLVVVAPATANCIGKLASGIGDDALSTLLLAMPPRQVLLAPAMNSQMWSHPSVQRNIETLKGWGIVTVGPAEGELACGVSGVGRMAEPEEIAAAISSGKWEVASCKWEVESGKWKTERCQGTAAISPLTAHRSPLKSGLSQQALPTSASTAFASLATTAVARWASPWPKLWPRWMPRLNWFLAPLR